MKKPFFSLKKNILFSSICLALTSCQSCKKEIDKGDTTPPTISFSYRGSSTDQITNSIETETQRWGGYSLHGCNEDYLIIISAQDNQSGIKRLRTLKKFVTNCDDKVTYSEPYEIYDHNFTLPNDSAWVSRLDARIINQRDLKSDTICIGAKKTSISGVRIQVEAVNGVGLTYRREFSVSCGL